MDYSPPGSSVHRISQAGIVQWVAISCSWGSSWPRGQTRISCNADDSLWHSLSECHSASFPPLNPPVFEATKILSPLLNAFPHPMLWFCLNTWTRGSVFQLRPPPGLWTCSRNCLQVQLHRPADSRELTWPCPPLSTCQVPHAGSLPTQAGNPGTILTSSHNTLAMLPPKELSDVLNWGQRPPSSPCPCYGASVHRHPPAHATIICNRHYCIFGSDSFSNPFTKHRQNELFKDYLLTKILCLLLFGETLRWKKTYTALHHRDSAHSCDL